MKKTKRGPFYETLYTTTDPCCHGIGNDICGIWPKINRSILVAAAAQDTTSCGIWD